MREDAKSSVRLLDAHEARDSTDQNPLSNSSYHRILRSFHDERADFYATAAGPTRMPTVFEEILEPIRGSGNRARRRGASKRSTMILNVGPRATTHLAIRHDLSLQSRESPLPYDPPAMTARIWTCITRSVHNSWNLRCRCINVVIVDRRWQVYLSIFLRCFSEKQASKINQLK